MVNILNLNREHLVPQSKDKKIDEIELSDLKLPMQKITMAEVIEFKCQKEKKLKILKHRYLTHVGEICALEL